MTHKIARLVYRKSNGLNSVQMSPYPRHMITLAVAVIFSTAVVSTLAQTATVSDPNQEELVIVKLSPPVYSQLAKQARITGDVKLTLTLRQDGSLESAVVVSGHPILQQAALDSIQQSRFECRNCNEGLTSLPIVYIFQLGPATDCGTTTTTPNDAWSQQRYPQVTQSQGQISLLDQPVGTCDIAPTIGLRVRSARCFYLWKCGIRYFL